MHVGSSITLIEITVPFHPSNLVPEIKCSYNHVIVYATIHYLLDSVAAIPLAKSSQSQFLFCLCYKGLKSSICLFIKGKVKTFDYSSDYCLNHI